MINDNRSDFMNAVSMKAEDYRARAFEACMEGLMKSVIKESLTVDVPKNADVETKTAIANEVKSTIDTTSKEVTNNAIVNDYDQLFNVDLAKEIINPKDFCEAAQKMIAEGVFAESNDRAELLKAQFDAGKFEGIKSEEVLEYVEHVFGNEAFDTRFENGKTLKDNLHYLLSAEGEELVEDIKHDVAELVKETEAKNSVIREAVSEINEAKAKIEEKINGDAEKSTDDSENASNDDTSNKEESETSTEGWFDKAVKNKKVYSTEDFYQIYNMSSGRNTFSSENFEANFDKDSFSREAAENILKDFKELDKSLEDNEYDSSDMGTNQDDTNAQSVSDAEYSGGDETTPLNESASADLQSTSDLEYTDNIIEYNEDHDKFVNPEPLEDSIVSDNGMEGMARDFVPLSYKKIDENQINVNNGKFAAVLALSSDHGQRFFNQVRNRSIELSNMLSKEDAICDGIAKEDIENKLEKTLGLCNQIELDVNTITEDLGILGILEGKYQRTDDPIQNAVTSLVKPTVIKPMGKDMSKEELYEHDLAEIFKLALKKSDIQSEIADGVDIIGNKEQLGYIDELLNEKMFKLDDVAKFDVEQKVKALQSIESMVGLDEIVNMQVFISSECPDRDRITLDSIKDIDAYGFSYIDEVEEIKKNVRKNFDEYMKGEKSSFSFNVDELVDFVLDEQDTTKITSNLYEKIVSKLVEDKTIHNSTEGLIIRNKAKAIATGFLAASKMGYLTENDISDIRNYYN